MDAGKGLFITSDQYMNYTKYSIEQIAPEAIELLIGHLSILPFEAFEEKENAIDAYLAPEIEEKEIHTALDQLQNRYSFTYRTEMVPNRNWNALWESNFQPIQVEDFCYIHASFHPVDPAIPYHILIEPKMAFGTGHHETTHMMIALMEKLNFNEKSVFDFGCGTGILAILANLLGAAKIEAIDIDQWAVENTRENIQHNQCENIFVHKGEIAQVKGNNFDFILANINRNVILKTLDRLKQLLNKQGTLLISGILITDQDLILDKAAQLSLKKGRILNKGEWCAIEFNHMQP